MIYFKNLDQMATFYGNTLGLPIVTTTRTDTWVEFGTGTATLHRTPPQPREENPIKLIFGVKDLESECARLQVLGVDWEIHPWGACDGIDPEGNIFQLRQIP